LASIGSSSEKKAAGTQKVKGLKKAQSEIRTIARSGEQD
jgi:hypothetical protein